MTWDHDALLPYRLRTVAIGIRTTVLTLVAMAVYPLLPRDGEINAGPYAAVVVAAAVGVFGVSRLPWETLFARRLGIPVLYAWSVLDILLIGIGVAVSGPAGEPLFLVYMLTTIFFAASYPPRGQAVLLAFTLGSYAGIIAAMGWEVSPATLFFRLSSLCLVGAMASFLSRELTGEVTGHRAAREESESRAGCLAVVADAARSMSAIDPDRVVGIIVDAAVRLGFSGSEICLFDVNADTGADTWSVSYRAGTMATYDTTQPAGTGVAGLVRDREATVVLEDYASWARGVPEVRSAGFHATVASPIWSQGELVGTLISGRQDDRRLLAYEVECHDLLAAQAGAALDTYRLFEARREFEEQLAHQAFHDPLTDLPNRALFADRLAHALARAGREGSRVGVLFVDLDRFKTVNDSLGHEAGDRLLAAVATRLGECLRPGDTLARHGGDEFTVLLDPISSEDEAAGVAERLLDALSRPFLLDDREVFMAASVGVAASAPGCGQRDLLREADLAMYRAKERGRGRWELFHRDMAARALARLQSETELRQAVEQDQFQLVYQPLVSLRTGRVEGVEALARWCHPTRGVVSPADFIPLAEETGLIVPLGRWVLEQACRQAAEWRADGRPTSIAVNLSVRQLEEPDLVGEVADILGRTGLDPRSLVFEITESAVVAEVDATVGVLRALGALGIRLALDDFGQGYSSLGYLQRFPLDSVKIDKSFVQGMADRDGDRAIVRSVVTLAADLGLAVTAEGVETAAQLEQVRELGCDSAQGFFFSPPVEPDAARRMIGEVWRAAEPAAP